MSWTAPRTSTRSGRREERRRKRVVSQAFAVADHECRGAGSKVEISQLAITEGSRRVSASSCREVPHQEREPPKRD